MRPQSYSRPADDTARAFGDELAKRRKRVTVEDLAPRNTPPPPRWAKDSLEKSRALSGEGLEGLPERASQLLRLGAGFFLPFWPFMLAFSVLFTLTFWAFGDDFLHSGDYFTAQGLEKAGLVEPGTAVRTTRPAYIVPEALLAEETVDRMVPFDQAPPPR